MCAGAVSRQEALDSLAGPSLLPEPGSARHITAHLTKQSVLPQHQAVLQPLTEVSLLDQNSSHYSWWCHSSQPVRGSVLIKATSGPDETSQSQCRTQICGANQMETCQSGLCLVPPLFMCWLTTGLGQSAGQSDRHSGSWTVFYYQYLYLLISVIDELLLSILSYWSPAYSCLTELTAHIHAHTHTVDGSIDPLCCISLKQNDSEKVLLHDRTNTRWTPGGALTHSYITNCQIRTIKNDKSWKLN